MLLHAYFTCTGKAINKRNQNSTNIGLSCCLKKLSQTGEHTVESAWLSAREG